MTEYRKTNPRELRLASICAAVMLTLVTVMVALTVKYCPHGGCHQVVHFQPHPVRHHIPLTGPLAQ